MSQPVSGAAGSPARSNGRGPAPSFLVRGARTGWTRFRRGALIGGGVLVAAIVIGALSFGPVVRWAVDRKAAALGLQVEVAAVRPGLGSIVLSGARVTPEWFPGLTVQIDRVRVWPSWRLGIGRLEANGGQIRIVGSVSDLREAWRARRSGGEAGTAAGASRFPIAVAGLSLVWEQAFDEASPQHAWGLSFQRAEDGTETVAADLIRGGALGSGVEAGGLRAVFRRYEGRRVLSEVSARGVRAHVDLDGQLLGALLGREETEGAAAPKGHSKMPPQPAVSADETVARRRSRGRRLRQALGSAAKTASSLLEPGGKVALSGVRAELRRGSEQLNVGPARLTVQRSEDAVDVQLVPGTRQQPSAVTLGLGLPIGPGPVRLQLAGGPVSLEALGVREGDMGLVGVDRTRLDVDGRATLAADGSSLSLSGRWSLDGLALEHEKLAKQVIRGIAIGGKGAGKVALDGSHVTLEDVEVSVGKVKAAVSADIARQDGEAKGWAELSVPLASCQGLFESTPRALLPDLAGMKLSGNFSFNGRVSFDTLKPADIEVTWKNQYACRITAVPEAIHPSRFERSWRRTVEDGEGGLKEIESGPGSPNWVPLYDISPHMETAITVCEDARFRYHEGFDHKAIADSIKDNVKAGRFVRGASTVTMQLAKNLYLERDKTLSRKLQEAVLTMLLEQEFSKDEILELYLNVIEFGPGIYGIGPAASHYFHVLPRELSLGQCMYLASILPNPKRSHFTEEGTLTAGWSDYIERLMRIAHKIRRVSDEELEAALAEEIRKGRPYDPLGEEPLDIPGGLEQRRPRDPSGPAPGVDTEPVFDVFPGSPGP